MIQKYLSQFLSLNTNKYAGKLAPHKPILLLSVLDMYENGRLADNKIELSEDLEKTFVSNWKRYIGDIPFYRPNVDKPFWHMKNEAFWTLKSKTSGSLDSIRNPYSIRRLRENVYAEIDSELSALLKKDYERDLLRKALIERYLKVYSTAVVSKVSSVFLMSLLTHIAS